jgi:hypothetical protein
MGQISNYQLKFHISLHQSGQSVIFYHLHKVGVVLNINDNLDISTEAIVSSCFSEVYENIYNLTFQLELYR